VKHGVYPVRARVALVLLDDLVRAVPIAFARAANGLEQRGFDACHRLQAPPGQHSTATQAASAAPMSTSAMIGGDQAIQRARGVRASRIPAVVASTSRPMPVIA